MINKLFLLAVTISVLFGCQTAKVKENRKPEYPLYSPYFGEAHKFSNEDLKKIASNFDFVYGKTLTREEMDFARSLNPSVQFIRYIGGWAINAVDAEKTLKRNIIYYPFACLSEDISENTSVFKLNQFPGSDTIILKASTTTDSISLNSKEYVVWIRISSEMMKVVEWNVAKKIVKVIRNFDGSGLSSHRKGEVTFLPAYYVAPDNKDMYGDPAEISYHLEPVSDGRWNRTYNMMKEFVTQGGDGIWIDILSDGCFGAFDIDGKGLTNRQVNGKPILHSYWDFQKDTFFLRDDYRRYNEIGVNKIQGRFRNEFEKEPVIYGNNMQAAKFEEGTGGCKFYLLPTDVKPRPVDGMCIEDFMGGYDEKDWNRYRKTKEYFIPGKTCYPCEKNYKNWVENVKEVMKCAQNGMSAVPLIVNAGMKTAQFEGIPREQRHEWELWAYASYLMGVEKKDGNCPTKLGIPMFYVENGKRFVDVDPIYYLRIGEPIETNPPDQILNYRENGTEVFSRNFSGGTVLVNPSENEFTIKLEKPLFDPDSGEKVSEITMSPQSGKILLKRL